MGCRSRIACLLTIDSMMNQFTPSRGALQVTARVYDPLGLFSVATLQAKLELQTLWQWKLDWDDELSEGEKT